MKKSVLITAMVIGMPLLGFADHETQEKDVFGAALKARIEQCKPHFDIEPYIVLAFGGERDERITKSVEKSLADFSTTGKLIISAKKKNNPTAVSCATFAEGLLVGGVGAQMVAAIPQAFEMVMDGMMKGLAKAASGEVTQGEKKDSKSNP